ncbi:S8 family peptidase [Pseudomonas sp. Marseille-QA0892]
MTEPKVGQRLHFHFKGTGQQERFRSTASASREPRFPQQDRTTHGAALLGQLRYVGEQMTEAVNVQRQSGRDSGFGLQIEFRSFPEFELAFEGLARGAQRIELLNLRRDRETQTDMATVFVPDGQLKAFESLIRQYLEVNTSKGQPRNAPLLNPIQEIRFAAFSALWTDDPAVLPENDTDMIWWEFWLPVREDREAVLNRFRAIVESSGFITSDKTLHFPERTVLNVFGSKAAITQSILLLNEVAEIRRAKETAEFFDALPPTEQRQWVDELLARTTAGQDDSVRVCLLDTGVNPGHPLLAPHIGRNDLHSVDPAWGVQDNVGHGTGLAGLALYGDLVDPLLSQSLINIRHRVESVKLLPAAAGNQKEPYGALTMSAVGLPEIARPDVNRIFSMAITSTDDRDRGRPSAWSAAVDGLASDVLGERKNPRLIVVSAGNADQNQTLNYPDSNTTDGIHDPGQSWNAICVGAYTQKAVIDPPNATLQPVAPAGSLSPYSTTSLTWQRTSWPLKPDVVFEGGNLVKDHLAAYNYPSVSLLTTSHTPAARLFDLTKATSAASALAARMAAQILAMYPVFWPETIRALMVHSAEWTDRMKHDFLGAGSKADYERLVKICGFGVPDLGRALWSAGDSLTLIVEDELQPFMKPVKGTPTARDMHLHDLPWPKQELLDLGNINVEMRVTLSYFVEPNPGVVERGIKGRYRYESHGLRFDVSRPTEEKAQFRQRINKRARDEEEGTYQGGGSDPNWLLGTQTRHRGSLHSDIWRGTAAELADRGMIGIYPALGWWKTLLKQERYNDRVRYSLVVSIKTEQIDIDLYAAIQNEIAARTAIMNTV